MSGDGRDVRLRDEAVVERGFEFAEFFCSDELGELLANIRLCLRRQVQRVDVAFPYPGFPEQPASEVHPAELHFVPCGVHDARTVVVEKSQGRSRGTGRIILVRERNQLLAVRGSDCDLRRRRYPGRNRVRTCKQKRARESSPPSRTKQRLFCLRAWQGGTG